MDDSTATTANPMLADTDVLRDADATDARAFDADATDVLPLMRATAPDGGHLLLVVRRDDAQPACTVYRDGEPVFSATADEPGIDSAVDHLIGIAEEDGLPTFPR